jgi:hypothetical protein
MTTFPLEKILTISATEYCEMSGKNLSRYKAVGVHDDSMSYWGDPTEHFSGFVPAEAEVVVNYQLQRTLGPYESAQPGANARGVQFTAHGTALILRNNQGDSQ